MPKNSAVTPPLRSGGQQHGREGQPLQGRGGDLHLRHQHRQDLRDRIFRGQIFALERCGRLGGGAAGLGETRLGLVGQVAGIDVWQRLEAVRRPVAGVTADEDGQTGALERVHDGLHPLAPEILQHLGVQKPLGHLAEEVRLYAAAGRGVAIQPHEREPLILPRHAVGGQGLVQLIFVEVALEGAGGEFTLGLAVRQPREQAHLLQREIALPIGLQHVAVHVRQSLQAFDLELVVAQGAGDGGGVHLLASHLADGSDDIGHVNGRALDIGQHGRDGLSLLGLEQLALDRERRVEAARLEQLLQGEEAAAAVEHQEGLLALAPRPDRQGDDHIGGGDGLGQLRDALVGGRLEADVLRREREILQRHVDLGGGGRCVDDVGHGIGFQRRGRGPSCPWAHPSPPYPSSFRRCGRGLCSA